MYPYEKKFDHVVKLEKENNIATITLDCPENINRINEQLVDELGAALDNVHWDKDVRAVILRGTGDVSFGPGDIEIIKNKLAKNLLEAREIMIEIGNVLKKMYTIAKPIIGVAEA